MSFVFLNVSVCFPYFSLVFNQYYSVFYIPFSLVLSVSLVLALLNTYPVFSQCFLWLDTITMLLVSFISSLLAAVVVRKRPLR